MNAQTIAILHYVGPPYVGGVEITMAAQARAIAADGRQVRILSGRCDSPKNWLPPELVMAVTSYVLPELGSRGALVEKLAAQLANNEISEGFYELVARLMLWLEDALLDVDTLIIHNVLSMNMNLALTMALWRLHQAGRLPHLLAWCHDFAWLDSRYLPELHPGQPWDLLRQPWPNTRYVAISEERRIMLSDLFGLPVDQITVAPPGIDLEIFLKLEPSTIALCHRLDLLSADPLLLLPSRFVRRKNIELAITIISAMRQRGRDARLIVTGPPDPHSSAIVTYLAELQELRVMSGVEKTVIFLYESYCDSQGQAIPVSEAMISDLYRLADGLLFPSRYEGFGIPLLEAGLSGMPIFCSDIAPFRETANNKAVFFQLDTSPEHIAETIDQFFQHDSRFALRRQIRLNATWDARYKKDIIPLLR